MDVLEKLLLDLNQSIEARDQYSNCSSIISSIESIALSPLDTTELEICTGYLIHSENPPSIVEYLIQTSRFKDREIIKAKVSGLKFLANYVKIYPEICSIHVEYLITTLIDAYKKEESGEVKAALLLPLKNILRVRIPSRASTSPSSNNGQFIYPPLDSDAIKLNVLYTALIDELRFGKKVTKGMTCESLKLLGIVVAVFPSHIITISTIEKIIDLCNGVLKSNINSSCKDPDFPGIAGAFSCLDRVYFQHEDKCTNTAELWGYLLKTIDKVTAADISRYAACEKAIRFVKNHSVPFQDLIGINASQTYDIVYAAHNSDKKSILKHSEEALNAIIAETAEFLVKNTQSEESQISKAKHAAETVYKLLNGFLKIVKDTSQYSNSEALFYALKGIILIAPAIPRIGLCLKLKEPVNCSNLIYVMMDCANQYQRYVDFKDAANAGGDVGKYGSYAYRKSLFLSSTASLLFACFLDGIQDVDQRSAFVELMLDHKLQVFLDEYITQSLIGYVRLWKKQQYLVNQSLVKITLICLFGCSDGKVKNIAHTNIIDSPQTSFICNEILTNMIKTLLIRSVGRNDSQATIAADSMLISNLTGEVEDHLFGYYISCSRELLAPNHQGTKTTVLQTIGASAYQLMQEKLVDILLLESITMIKSLDLSYVTSEEVVDDGIPWLPTNIMDQDIMINFALFFSALIPFVKKQLLFNRLHYTLEPLMELSKSYPLVSSFYSIVQCVLTAVEDYITYSIPSISKYLKFVQFKLEGSITDFKGELLDSAIKLILSAPLCLLSSEEVISVVKTSLTSGVQVLLAIKLLMKYLIQDSNNVLKYIGDLLPLMSKYLTPNDIKSVNTKGKVSNEDEEKALKYTLLDFLGRLGSYNKSLLESPDQALQNSFSWSQEVFLTISLNTTTSIVLDEVFVSLIHDIRDLLAASTMNQQLTTCAEALHSMTMILIGKTGTFANKRESPYPVIWSGTIPILLKLSVKGLSCQSLFETLMLQLTRWFGTVGSVHVDDVSAFLESIFSSLCAEESDASEREFSSRILLEYFQWSMRQNTSSSKITSNLQDFFGKVVMLLSHPSEFYQRGGVAIVTKIYRLLREDNLLVNRYGMQLFYLLLKVLHQTPSVSLVKECDRIVQKLEEIIVFSVVKKGSNVDWNSYNEERGFPRQLNELLDWIWLNCLVATRKEFRRSCMRCFIPMTSVRYYESNTSINNVSLSKQYLHQWLQERQMNHLWKGVQQQLEEKFPALVENSWTNDLSMSSAIQRCTMFLDVYTWLLASELLDVFDYVKYLILPEEGCALLHQTLTKTLSFFQQYPSKDCEDMNLKENIQELFHRYVIFMQILLKKTESRQLTIDVFACNIVSFPLLDTVTQMTVGFEQEITGGKDNEYQQLFTSVEGLFRLLWRTQTLHRDEITKFLNTKLKCFLSMLFDDEAIHMINIASKFLHLFQVIGTDVFGFELEATSAKQQLPHAILTRALALAVKDNASNNVGIESAVHAKTAARELARVGLEYGTSLDQETGITALDFSSQQSSNSSNAVGKFLNTRIPEYPTNMMTLFLSNKGGLIVSHFSDFILHAFNNPQNGLYLGHAQNRHIFIKHLTNRNILALFDKFLVGLSSSITQELERDRIITLSHSIFDEIDQQNMVLQLPEHTLMLILSLESQCALFQSHHTQFITTLSKACIDTFSNANKVDVSEIQSRLSWLPFLIPGITNTCPRPMRKASLDRKLVTQLCESVEEMTVEKFPLESKQLNPDSDQGREYLAILKSYLQAFEQTGCSHLLTPLLPSFREGKAHRYYDYLKDTLLRTAEDITLPSIESADEICDICNFSLNVVLDSFQDLIVKRVFFQSIFLPTIEKLNTKDFHRIVSSGKQGLVLNMTLINMPQTPNFVKSLMDIITKDINYITAESHEIQTILFLQICSFRMLEFLFDHCALKDIKTSFTQLYVGEGVTCTGKELTQALCKVAFKVGKAPVANFTYEDLLLELRAAAYRCLAVTVAKTQTEEQFFDTFLFKTKPGEDLWNKITLAGLTSPHELQEIVLKTDYESFETLRFGSGEESQLRPNDMTRLRRLAIHARVGAGKGGALTQYVDASMLVSSNINMGSMATQSALDTSTSASDERVTSEYSPSQYQLLVDTASKSSSTKSYEVDNEEDVVAGWDDHVIYLEMNHFNQASIMPVLVRVVQRMFVVFKDKWEKNLAVLPNWLNEVKTKLSDFTSTAATTRLFFLRLILNQPIASLIEPWIQELMPAILECASMDLCPSSHASAKYCYLLRDLVFTLCDTWKRALPNAFSVFSASKILSFLLANVKDDDIDKLKENTLSVCALIKLWIGAQSPGQNEYSLKVDQLVTLLTTEASFTGGAHAKADSKGSINVRLRLAGLELLSTLLSVKYPLLQKHGPESAGASRLIESVLSCLRFPRKEVMEFACKVAGEMLKAFHSSTQQHLLHEDLQSLDNNLRTVIESKNHLKDGPDQMIACIRKVVEQCPSFVSREMIMKIVNSFPKLKFKSKYDYLYVLSNATNEFEDLSFIDLMRPYFKSNFADLSTASFGWGSNALRLPVVQVGTLLYLSKHVHQINADHVSVLLGSSEAEGVRLCTSSKSPLQVRDAAYQFLITLCRTHAEILACITSTEAATVSTSWKKVAKDVLKMLLTGLTDSDDEGMFVDDVTEQFHTFADYENPKFWSKSNQLRMGIRKRIYAFFMKDFGLGANLAERVLVVSSTLFDPTNEDWIKSAGYLLLHGILSDEKANAKNPLFTNNLAPTESYTEYQIPANRLFMATSKSSMTMPMFSLERTTQSINSILQSQQMTQAPLSMSAASIILSQSNITATQGFRRMTPLGGGGRSGVIKGTQQMSWTQTQSEEASSSSVIGTNLSSSKGYSSSSTSASSSTYANNLTQFGSTTTMSQATKYHTPASQGAGGDIDSMLMPPPSALPKYITTQRVPTRFKSKASTGDASDSTASTATRKVNIQQIFASKKLKADEEAKRKQRVSFFRRYRTGDLPDISISLQDAFAPLSLVCLYQPAVSYQIYISITQLQLSNETFLSSFAKQVVSNINSSRGVANDARMISMLVDRLNQCQLKLSQHTNLTPVMIPDRVVTDLCMETGNMFVGLEYLEAKLDRMILHDAQVALPAESQVDEASSSKVSSKRKKSEISQSSRSKSTRGATLESTDSVADALFDNSRNARIAEGSSTAVTTTSDNIAPLTIGEYIPTWSQLIRLYDQLKEHDILMGLALKVTSNSSYSVKTKLALDAELRGDYLEALTLYNEMADESWSNTTNDRKRNREEDEVKQVDTSIVDLWLDRSMNCTQKLGDWNKLHDFMVTKSPLRNIESNVASLKRSSSGDRAPLPGLQAISSNDLQKYVPVYLRTLLHIVGDNPPDQNELIEQGKAKVSSFMDRVFSEHLADKAWLEANSSIELAMANILQQDWTKGKMHSEMAYETFLQKWASLHPSAFQAREMLLLQLQKIVEIRDICASQWHNNTAIRQENYEDDLIYLWNLSDPSINDPLHHWLDISMIRKFGLSKGFGKALATTSSLHVAQFQVKTALAGAHQGVLPVIKSLLEKNNQLRKPIFGSKRVILTMNEVNVVTLYNQKSILRKPLDSPEILDMLQKTEKLLKRKQELLTQCEREHQSNANVEMIKQAIAKERLQVSLLQGDWSMFWHRYESDKSSHATGLLTATNASHHSVQQVLGEKKLASMQSYLQAMQQTTGTDQSWLLEKTLSTMTKFCDQLLDDLEGRLAVGSSAAEEFAEQLMVLIQQHPMVKSLSAVDKKKSTSLQDSILNKFAYFVVVMMVQGLQVGSSYCRDRILRMISIVSKYPTYTKDYFTAQLANIPSWVFLRFANQMMGNLDQVEGPTVLPILTRLCTEYPFAMHYNYRITSENFGKQGQQLSAPLKVQLANKSIDAFVEALNGLTHPELRWTDGLKELDTLLKQYQSLESSSKAKTMLGEDIIAIFQQLKDDCLATSWSHVGNLIGKYNLQFAKYANKEVQSILGNKDVEKALLTTKNTIEKLRAISSNHQQRNTHLTSGKVDLVEFSTWLSDFDDLTTRLEVPGQYSQYTHRKPSPHLHEYISSVDQKLLVMTSIRKPKRVKFYGHLGNESMFLVKGGEDLRNDERIEQLFMLMNQVVQQRMNASASSLMISNVSLEELCGEVETRVNAAAAASNSSTSSPTHHSLLQARTYTVVPMSSKVGILEWVKNTIPLKSILSQEMAKDAAFLQRNPQAYDAQQKEVDLSKLNAYRMRLDWIRSHDATDYHDMFAKAQRHQAEKIYHTITSDIPKHFVKKYFQQLTTTPEAYFTFRSEFARSLAVSSVYGYILGIGDRHLENLLIDTRRGSVVQIDFGICFGIGSSMLPVPELIPFRLTPQLRHVLQPLDGTALLRQYMIKVFQILREDSATASNHPEDSNTAYSGVIANALEIYINDPVVDWLKGLSSKNKDEIAVQREMIESSTKKDGKRLWEPVRRIQIAIRKLRGEDPIQLMLEDLRQNNAVIKCKTLNALTNILESTRTYNGIEASGASGTISSMESQGWSQVMASAPPSTMAWEDSMAGGSISSSIGSSSSSAGKALQSTRKFVGVGEQVDLLINMATDPNVLARQWGGLQTWL